MTTLDFEKPLLYAMAYAFLAASSFCSCWSYYSQQKYLSIGIISFGLCLATGLLGAWIYTQIVLNKKENIKYLLMKAFETLKFFTSLYTLPLVIGDMYLKYELSKDLLIAHMFLPLLGLVPCGVIKSHNQTPTIRDITIFTKQKLATKSETKQYINSMDFVTFINTISLSVLSCVGNNVFGVLAAIIYAITYFIITEKGKIGNCIPAEPLHILGLGVFCGMAMKNLISFYVPTDCITINR